MVSVGVMVGAGGSVGVAVDSDRPGFVVGVGGLWAFVSVGTAVKLGDGFGVKVGLGARLMALVAVACWARGLALFCWQLVTKRLSSTRMTMPTIHMLPQGCFIASLLPKSLIL